MTHSTDLQWLLVRQNSKFLQKRNGIRLSSDPFNNNANWTKRQSGFLNTKAAVIKTKGDRILLTTKSGDTNNKPKLMYKKTVMEPGVKSSVVKRAVADIRPDLAKMAYRRARKMACTITRMKKVCAARKERSSKMHFHRKTVRPKRN
ncbi:60S ribosomal protein L28, putative [Trypanosoma equiperdum]|uniref:60S ribosomal protein L28, putative n=3 Tax=Trypanozoon TaxID=39700 RepID=Q385E9_TRYB2|nr:60S ribosomal protein L28, putative [Trypanosoma brucei brucei TREU927]XP_828694.1 60S ribosomal protein L28, putative [Trypanosoma brucei brucei TREU927]4V8M_Bc Chain Bc, 60S RIBOSOMAL PROTEIN L28, PUTATIVE [Trypanosoma brucei brucei TREU927]8OVA_Bc Chain Bc, 60S ribosomal protein L28, putative [Trypanosoma brucei brucei]8OVE_Bc Chain Bc, 60S ribosomal protein L28, putative [Trypanosoma brucei brucei]RHW67173.1 60S ribosomal protein L28 [Trypanosoma brucei equiperdum]SCU70722.1 60S riboso